jgi:hypothetical protein
MNSRRCGVRHDGNKRGWRTVAASLQTLAPARQAGAGGVSQSTVHTQCNFITYNYTYNYNYFETS